MSQAIQAGMSRYMLYSLRDRGVIDQISRGVYRMSKLPKVTNPDLITVSLRSPKAVIFLISALAYHNITTQIPHTVNVALPIGSRAPSIDYPSILVYKFSNKTYLAGIETHQIDGVAVKVYNVEKTLADCFKFRNKIGMDVVLEALKYYKARKKINLKKLLEYARICRVEKMMRPYLEAML